MRKRISIVILLALLLMSSVGLRVSRVTADVLGTIPRFLLEYSHPPNAIPCVDARTPHPLTLRHPQSRDIRLQSDDVQSGSAILYPPL